MRLKPHFLLDDLAKKVISLNLASLCQRAERVKPLRLDALLIAQSAAQPGQTIWPDLPSGERSFLWITALRRFLIHECVAKFLVYFWRRVVLFKTSESGSLQCGR